MTKRTALVLFVAVVFAACSPTSGPPETTATTLTAPVTVSTTTTSTPIDWVAYVEDAVDFMEANHFQADEKD